ncbi:unnamed protein product [Thlaspi arvense]|uniref:Uncharacterized protein n=1 Tax=Thlaspi arvense TaxID=13288 RepID=A0AAU9SBY7_THLAR|nr:unnamed protein product [Thlaspi arvense]
MEGTVLCFGVIIIRCTQRWEEYWQETGSHGKLVFKYKLKRIPGQPELSWKVVKQTKKSENREGLCRLDISEGHERLPICAETTSISLTLGTSRCRRDVEANARDGERERRRRWRRCGETAGFTVDAAKKGNIGRFINHSCSPNLYAQNVLYDHEDKRIPHVMLFAMDNIPPLQELTYHYNYMIDQVRDVNGNIKKKICYCGSSECTGRLY